MFQHDNAPVHEVIFMKTRLAKAEVEHRDQLIHHNKLDKLEKPWGELKYQLHHWPLCSSENHSHISKSRKKSLPRAVYKSL